MAPKQPTLLEYARFYNIAEESTRYCPINYADETCEPATPIPPVEGLNPEHPEERLKEIDRRFCTGLMMERLETKPEDMELLSKCLQLDPVKGNIWRGILPEVTTSEHKGEPFLLTSEDERMVTSAEFHTTFAQSQVSSSPSPSVPLIVPSGPDVSVVPVNARDVFELYNSGMASQSNTVGGVTTPSNVTAESSNITATSHLEGDALPPIVGPSGTVHQFISIESDPVPSIADQGSEEYDPSVVSSEHLTESDFSAFVFDNAVSTPPLYDVSPQNKSQSASSIVSPNLTKEKGFSVGRVDGQKAQARRALKGKKGARAVLEPVGDTGIPCEQEGILADSLSALHEDTLVSKGTCSSSSTTRPANDQNINQLARNSQNANDNHVSFKAPYEQNPNLMATHTSSSVDKRDSCVAQKEQFFMKLGYRSHSTGLRKVPSKPPHAVSSVDYTETPKPPKPVFGGLGSLSVFMQTRGSDGVYVTSSHDPSSLSTSTRSEAELLNVPSLVGDSPPDSDEGPTGISRSPSPARPMQRVVTESAFNPPPMFFLSTSLLTTHPLVIRGMEEWANNPPRLIYREYGDASSDSRYHCDAEVILAPDAGLILTNPHELTQRYLPGHGPRDARLNGIQGINSPLREKIFRLMHRHGVLVVLICKPERADFHRVSNDSLVRESTLLAEFCDSQEELATTLVIPITNHPADIIRWCFGMGRLRYELFPPDVMENITEEESEYEVALRDLGINPFAARLILDNIRVGGFNQYPGFDLYPLPLPSHETVANETTDSRAFDVFISMEPLERDMEYGSFLGGEVMNRVSEAIESMHSRSPNENETDSEDIYSAQISLD